MFEGPHPATRFTWQPDAFSFVVAMLAGTIPLASAKSVALVGVAISVITIPATFVQLVVNLVGIAVAGTLTLRLLPSRAR